MFQASFTDEKQLLRLAKSPSGVIGRLITGRYQHVVYAFVVEFPDGSRRGFTYRVAKDWADPTILRREVVLEQEAEELLTEYAGLAIPTYRADQLPAGFWMERF